MSDDDVLDGRLAAGCPESDDCSTRHSFVVSRGTTFQAKNGRSMADFILFSHCSFIESHLHPPNLVASIPYHLVPDHFLSSWSRRLQ
jgi:hypothetical protein